MATINYELLVLELVKPLTTQPEDVMVNIISEDGKNIKIQATVAKDDLGRVIGKKGRVANAIRTLAHAAATRNNEHIEIEFLAKE